MKANESIYKTVAKHCIWESSDYGIMHTQWVMLCDENGLVYPDVVLCDHWDVQ